MTNKTGDAPESEYREAMNWLAGRLDDVLNGDAKGDERKVGFVLLVFPFDGEEFRCNYVSNGDDRCDILALFKEQIRRLERT